MEALVDEDRGGEHEHHGVPVGGDDEGGEVLGLLDEDVGDAEEEGGEGADADAGQWPEARRGGEEGVLAVVVVAVADIVVADKKL